MMLARLQALKGQNGMDDGLCRLYAVTIVGCGRDACRLTAVCAVLLLDMHQHQDHPTIGSGIHGLPRINRGMSIWG
jgi:hypothetical protein